MYHFQNYKYPYIYYTTSSSSNVYDWVRNSWQQVKSETSVKSLIYVALILHKMEMKMTFYMKKVTHRVKTNMMVQFSGSADDFLRSMMNKLCNVC